MSVDSDKNVKKMMEAIVSVDAGPCPFTIPGLSKHGTRAEAVTYNSIEEFMGSPEWSELMKQGADESDLIVLALLCKLYQYPALEAVLVDHTAELMTVVPEALATYWKHKEGLVESIAPREQIRGMANDIIRQEIPNLRGYFMKSRSQKFFKPYVRKKHKYPLLVLVNQPARGATVKKDARRGPYGKRPRRV